MLKKLFVSFMTFAFITVQANAAANNNLRAAFDSLNYSLSVEWDQRDRAFYDAKMGEFTARVQELQAQGLTNAELIDFAISQVRDERLAQELRTTFSLIQVGMGQADVRKMVLDTMSKSYNRGASWSSDTLLVGGLIVLVLVVALAAAGAQVRGGGAGGCYDDYVCYDYFDGWGYYWYSDCYYETVCY